MNARGIEYCDFWRVTRLCKLLCKVDARFDSLLAPTALPGETFCVIG